MKKYKLDQLEFQTMEGFLSTFTPPNTYEMYDNVNDRSAVLNKYNFSQEIVHFKNEQKEILIQKLNKEIDNYSEELKKINNTLINIDKSINDLAAPKKIKEINLELEEIVSLSNSKQNDEPVDTKFYNKYSPIFSYSMNESNKEYMESLGLKYVVDIPKEHEDLLKKDLESGKINKEIYEKKYSNLMLAYTKLEVSDSYFDNLFKLYFDFIKPAMEVSPLNWLHKSHLFYPTNPNLMINDTPKDGRYVTPFNRDLGQKSILERFSLKTEEKRIRFYKENYNLDTPNNSELREEYWNNRDDKDYIETKLINPIYTSDVLNLNKSYLLEVAGLGNIFKDHPIYREHLAHEFEKTFDEKTNNANFEEGFNYEKNLFYLQNGYEKDSKTDKIRNILSKVEVKRSNLLTINSFEEFNSLNYSQEEKTKLFLNLLVACFKVEHYEKVISKSRLSSYRKQIDTISDENGVGNIFIIPSHDYNRIYGSNIREDLEKSSSNTYELKLRQSLSNKIGFHVFKANLFNQTEFMSEVTNEDLYHPNLITKRNYHLQVKSNSGMKFAPSMFMKLKNQYKVVGLILSDKDTNDYKFKVIIIEDENGNKKKYDFYDITNRFPYVKVLFELDEKDSGFNILDIKIETEKKIIINEDDFENLWKINLNIENDFEIIHNLYMNTIQNIDWDLEFDHNLILNNIWNQFYKSWFEMEQEKIDFWQTISNEVKYKINNESTKELKDFYYNMKFLLKDVYEKIMSQYSYEARTSEYFEFRLDIDTLINTIINEDKRSITSSYEVDKFYDRMGKYEQDNYVNNEFLKETFNNGKLKTFLNEKFNEKIQNISNEPEFAISKIGKHGVIVVDKILKFVLEKLNPLNRPKEVNPLSLYSNEVRELIGKMEIKYGKNFIDSERPPYFPTVKHIIKHVNLDEKENKLNSDLIKYYHSRIKPMIDIKSKYNNYIIPEYYNEKRWSGQFKKYRSLEKEVNDTIFIAKIVNGIDAVKDKSYELNKVIELEKDRSDLVEQHNKMAKEFKDKKEERKLLLPKYEETIKKMKELKLDNYVVTNNIDREKFIVTMKAIVDMTLNEFNKDKIIDLTKLDNIDDNLKKFEESLISLNTITKNALISNYILHINSLYEKRGLTEKFNLVELNPLKKEIILNDSENRKNTLNLISQHGINSQGREINKIKMYEGNHFPLFVDLESKTIWSVEWTTKYPTLNIYMLPEKYLSIEQNKEYFETFWDSLVDLNKSNSIVSLETFVKHFSIFDDRVKLKFDEEGIDYRLNNLDRIKDIFSLIQTNYFLQLEQLEEKSLFLDIDANYIYNSKPNIGAIPFMNKKDERILENTLFKQEVENFNLRDVNYINPFNYTEKDKQSSSLMIQKRKVDGFVGESKTKETMKIMQKETIKNKENDQIINKSLKNYSFTYETLYGFKNYSKNEKKLDTKIKMDDQIINIYDGQPNLIKIFKTLEELQIYKNNYENTLNKDMNFSNTLAS